MDTLISYKEAAGLLNVSYDTVRRMIADDRLSYVIVGKRKKIKAKDVFEIINGSERKIINLAAKLTHAGYSADQTAEIISIVEDII